MSDVSVIIVTWNGRDLVRECLESVIREGGSLIHEIIVADNASTDGTPDMVEKEFPGARLVRNPANLGFAKGNNVGMRLASGKYWALVNSDAVVHPGCLQRLVAFLEANLEVGLVGPKIVGRDGHLQRTCRRLPGLWNTLCDALGLDRVLGRWSLFSGREMRHWSQETQQVVEVLSGCFWVARREAVARVGLLDERFFFYGEDVDWCKRFRDAGWQVVFVPDATALHYGGGSSTGAPLRFSVELLRANSAYWRKHYGVPGAVAYKALSLLHNGLRLFPNALLCLAARGAGKRAEHTYKLNRALARIKWLLLGRMPA